MGRRCRGYQYTVAKDLDMWMLDTKREDPWLEIDFGETIEEV